MRGYLKKSWNEVKEMLEAKGLEYEEYVAPKEEGMYQAEDYIVVPAYGENGVALNFDEAGMCYEYEYLGWV